MIAPEPNWLRLHVSSARVGCQYRHAARRDRLCVVGDGDAVDRDESHCTIIEGRVTHVVGDDPVRAALRAGRPHVDCEVVAMELVAVHEDVVDGSRSVGREEVEPDRPTPTLLSSTNTFETSA